MKAIFAVTALAAAISGQALAADTESSTSFTGTMDAQFILNLQPDVATYDVDLNDDGDDNEGYEITMSTAVTNGPFSGSVGITTREGASAFDIGDIVVTDGMLSFGQVGSLMNTDQYTDGVEDDMAETKLDVDVAFRYAVSDSFKVQLQGLDDDAGTATGLAAAYTGSADALSFAVEGEMYASGPGSDAGLDPKIFAGAGVTYAIDAATVKAVFNYTGDTAGNTVIEYVASVSTTMAGATLFAAYQEKNTDVDDDESAKVEVSYAAGAFTPSAGYMLTTLADAGDEVFGKIAYSADNLDASAKLVMGNFDAATADEALIELRVSTKSEVGVTYYGEYDMQKDAKNQLTVGAKYAF